MHSKKRKRERKEENGHDFKRGYQQPLHNRRRQCSGQEKILEHPGVPDTTFNAYYCKVCESTMFSGKVWEDHVTGKRHLKNVRKIKTAIIGAQAPHPRIKHKKPKWKSDGQLHSKLHELGDTALSFDGRKEIYDPLKVAAYAPDRSTNAFAQAILDGANISLSSANIGAQAPHPRIKHEKLKWKSDVLLTGGQLQSKLHELDYTTLSFEGRKEIYDPPKVAAYTPDRSTNAFAQAILDGANISLSSGICDNIKCRRDSSFATFSNLNLAERSKTKSDNPSTSGHQSSRKCVFCFEEDVDSVLYRCGHMCMCYNCASEYRSCSGAHCPICRENILDVIQIRKS